MPSPEHQSYRSRILLWFRAHATEPDVAAQLERHRRAAALLWELDLEPAWPILQAGYAPSPRGAVPWDPILLLRCLLFMLLVGQPSINKWVRDLAGHRVLRIITGLPEDDWPGVGTLYDFLHRLHDGPVRGCCEHQERPSEAERRRSRSPRPLQRTEKAQATEQRQPAGAGRPPGRGRRGKKARKRDKAAIAAPVANPGATEKVVAALAASAASDNPNDLLARLSAILLAVGVAESAARGLLSEVDKLTVSGDGSMLRTGASRYGKRICDHPMTERCDCPRVFDDPDARVGYNAHRDTYFFGHHFYEVSVSTGGHDLPLALRLDAGNASDYTASLLTLDRLGKDLGKSTSGMLIRHFVADAGHDGEANYRYCLDHGMIPVIPLRGEAPAIHPTRPDVTLSKRGVPTCQANVEMAPWGSAGEHRKIFLCPVKAGKLKQCPLALPEQPDWVCEPAKKWGPTVNIDVRSNPRLCPPIPRNSPKFVELMKLRSGCERSNSVKKEVFKLEDARHRRASFWLMRLHFIAVLQHARAWVDDDAARSLVDHLLGRELVQQEA